MKVKLVKIYYNALLINQFIFYVIISHFLHAFFDADLLITSLKVFFVLINELPLNDE